MSVWFARYSPCIRRCGLAGAAALAMIHIGCMKVITEVYVKRDGSGTVTETMYIDRHLVELAEALGDRRGDVAPKPDKIKGIKRAQSMGEGVTYVSSEAVTSSNNDPGIRTVFAFDDIRTLRVGVEPESLAAEMQAVGGMQKSVERKPLTFAFSTEPVPTLKVRGLRQDNALGDTSGRRPQKSSGTDSVAQTSAKGTGMLEMLRGFGIWIRVRVEGAITETNALHVNSTNDGVTLLKIDFARILDQAEDPSRLLGLDKIDNLASAQAMLMDVPGVIIQPAEELTIAFK
ncbi:MAG: hypothetical protein GF418_12620 [Chitinivibrionales bacterium]|nr:hypothetical protein [Chitinivibrionales bacterium]MBD3396463.1 hypothetical protein [Chitinivibrionales bacterium]